MALIPAISSLLAIFFGAFIRSLGIFVISTEIMPEKIKDIGMIFCGAIFWILSYIFEQASMTANYYFERDFLCIVEFISAIVCVAGAIIIHSMLPETKAKSRQEIMKLL